MCVFQRPFLDKTKLIFFLRGLKGQLKWPLTLLIVFFVFLDVVFLVFESPFFCFLALLSWKGTTFNYWITMFSFLINPLFLFWFPVFVCLWIFVFFFLFFGGMLSFDYIRTAVHSIKYVFRLSLLILWGFLSLCFQTFLPFFFSIFPGLTLKNITVLLSQQCKLQITNFWSRGGLQHTVF